MARPPEVGRSQYATHAFFRVGDELNPSYGWQWVPDTRKPDGYPPQMGRVWARKIPMGMLSRKMSYPSGMRVRVWGCQTHTREPVYPTRT